LSGAPCRMHLVGGQVLRAEHTDRVSERAVAPRDIRESSSNRRADSDPVVWVVADEGSSRCRIVGIKSWRCEERDAIDGLPGRIARWGVVVEALRCCRDDMRALAEASQQDRKLGPAHEP